ncbi:hypothetical protein HANVADRAFT_47489 [Hanseniaspora valbyensis NRRL Y-1626]|uniref:Prefoldin beta-like protein n=1 Tax=Hanseniaspora valbyensis NRRL Y-1626 TaxID=766949 RepID=A0A1B7THZ3_9ASCO|nr:hypothetical protein HANVADRAFT_47489 [Hanseniaspora valbyensis NRRL Y-1626]
MSTQHIEAKYQAVQQLQKRLQTFKNEHEETGLVLKQIEDIKKTKKNDSGFDKRTCYRSVGGSLVETNVGEVIPHLTEKLSKLGSVIMELQQDYNDLTEEIRQDAIEYQKNTGK